MDKERLREYAFGGVESVSGWLGLDAVSLIVALAIWQEHNGIRGDVAEIGVHHGKLFCLLKNCCRSDELAYAVDVFEDQHLNVDRSGKGDRAIFDAHVAAHTDGNNVIVHQGDSLALSDRDFRGGVRLFSIDGSHTAGHTESDLRTAARCLAPGGVIILDDFYNAGWPGVQEGFHRFMAGMSSRFAVFAYNGTKALICRTEDHARLLAFVQELAPFAEVWNAGTIHDMAAFLVRLPQPDGMFGADLRIAQPPLSMMRRNFSNRITLVSGWGKPELNGTWTTDEFARMRVDLPEPDSAACARMQILATPFVHSTRPKRKIDVTINDRQLGSFVLTGAKPQPVDVRIPAGLLTREVALVVRSEQPESPAEILGTSDRRHLGVHVKSVRFV
jgi:hypothetical protein